MILSLAVLITCIICTARGASSDCKDDGGICVNALNCPRQTNGDPGYRFSEQCQKSLVLVCCTTYYKRPPQPPKQIEPEGGWANQCGKAAIKHKPGNRVVGGQEVEPYSWPWTVTIMQRIHKCGGTLINPRWVVTAAHCFVGRNMKRPGLYVKAAKHDRRLVESHEQIANAQTMFIHPKYNKGKKYDNDILLIKLDRELFLNDHVSLACLPKDVAKPGTKCYVAGWGNTFKTCCYGLLKQAMVPVLPHDVCTRPTWYGSQLTENMLCAGHEAGGHDACKGDSGGPLVCQAADGRWELQGVVSWGKGCAGERKPGLYTKVVNYLDWINEIIAKN